MKRQSAFRKFLLGVSLAVAANCASAAWINFVEDYPNPGDPFTVETNLLGANYTIGNEGVTFDGYHTPAISLAFLDPVTYVGGLLEGGSPSIVSDLVVLTAGNPFFDSGINADRQDIHIDVFSDDRLLSDVIAMYPFISASNFLVEDGTLQDISGVMNSAAQLAQDQGGTTLPFGNEGISVGIRSIPEPGTLFLLGAGLVPMLAKRRQTAAA